MSNKNTTVKQKNRNGELTLSHTTTDAPLLPVQQIEQLYRIDPALVDWVKKQTEEESAFRRKENKRVNTFVFTTQTLGQICALVVSLGGLAAAAYLGANGAQTAAAVIGGTTVVSLVSIFILGRQKQ